MILRKEREEEGKTKKKRMKQSDTIIISCLTVLQWLPYRNQHPINF
jgi:hypothetical protein